MSVENTFTTLHGGSKGKSLTSWTGSTTLSTVMNWNRPFWHGKVHVGRRSLNGNHSKHPCLWNDITPCWDFQVGSESWGVVHCLPNRLLCSVGFKREQVKTKKGKASTTRVLVKGFYKNMWLKVESQVPLILTFPTTVLIRLFPLWFCRKTSTWWTVCQPWHLGKWPLSTVSLSLLN